MNASGPSIHIFYLSNMHLVGEHMNALNGIVAHQMEYVR